MAKPNFKTLLLLLVVAGLAYGGTMYFSGDNLQGKLSLKSSAPASNQQESKPEAEALNNFNSFTKVIKIATDRGVQDMVFLDPNNDTLPSNGDNCSNIADDIILGGNPPDDCDAINITESDRFKVLSPTGGFYVFYDVNNDNRFSGSDVLLSRNQPPETIANGVNNPPVKLNTLPGRFIVAEDNGLLNNFSWDRKADTESINAERCIKTEDDTLLGGRAVNDCDRVIVHAGDL